MKIRNDFVSNSSSCSFIVKATEQKKLEDLADSSLCLLAVLSNIPEASFVPFEHFSESLLDACRKSKLFVVDSDEVQITLAKNATEEKMRNEIGLVKQLLSECSIVRCDFGLNDADEFTLLMGQAGAVFELNGFKVEDDEDSETPYDSMLWLVNKDTVEG